MSNPVNRRHLTLKQLTTFVSALSRGEGEARAARRIHVSQGWARNWQRRAPERRLLVRALKKKARELRHVRAIVNRFLLGGRASS